MLMKKLRKNKNKRSTFHDVGYGRVAVLPNDPTELVNYEGDNDRDFKFD